MSASRTVEYGSRDAAAASCGLGRDGQNEAIFTNPYLETGEGVRDGGGARWRRYRRTGVRSAAPAETCNRPVNMEESMDEQGRDTASARPADDVQLGLEV